MIRKGFPAFLPLIFLAGCGNAEVGDIVAMCLTVNDCHYLEIEDCTMPDCVDGQCVLVADRNADGLACGTSNRCVKTPGRCETGVCVGARQEQCPGIPCMVGRCDPETGSCAYTQAPEKSSCDVDGNPCTSDICEAGSCRKGPNSCPCLRVSDCPNPLDLCAGVFTCRLNFCEIDEMTRVICPADSSCYTHACNSATGQCERTDMPDDTVCAQEGPCTLQGRCGSGICVIPDRCDDGNQCTTDNCDSVSGACDHQPSDGACDDEDQCTGPDACVLGVCRGQPVSCDDRNPCTIDSCDSVSGCVNEPDKAGTPCDSGDLCVVGSVCDENGVCGNGSPKCDDQSDCTIDTCESGLCDFVPVQGACDDGNSCTLGERCLGGVCGEGRPVPGCCNFAADCDDNDQCTVSACVDSECVHQGEPVGLCGGNDGCTFAWCQADSGQCGQVASSFPLVISSWDFVRGDHLIGFGWGSPAGSIGSAGLHAVDDQAAVVFPRRIVPSGVLQSIIRLDSGECGNVTFSNQPAGLSCIQGSDGAIVLAAFSTDSVCDSDGRIGLQFIVAGGAVIRSADLVLLAMSGCDVDGLRVEGTGSATDIAAASRGSLVALAFRKGSNMSLAATRTGGGIMAVDVAQDPFGVVSGRFGATIVDAGDRWALAWGAADDRVWIATANDSGVVSVPRKIPDVASEGEIHAWPSLAVDSAGRLALAMSYSQSSDFDIALGLFDKDLSLIRDFERVNESDAISRTNPILFLKENQNLIAWINELDEPSKQFVYKSHGLNADYLLNGLDFSIGVQSTEISQISITFSVDRYFCVWARADGGIGGVVLDSGTLALKGSFEIPGPFRSRPQVVATTEGALVVSISGTGATASIIAQSVSVSGAVSEPFVVASPVLAGLTSFAVTSFGPVHHVIAYSDILSDEPGIRIVPFSGKCPGGFISGNSVCTGIGDDGRAGGVLP
ncbi:MAG TPA: hypothetical protein PLC24_02890 [Myxococcota bacterium]|nr:hypothetical protein [Myxococcota bacterium]